MTVKRSLHTGLMVFLLAALLGPGGCVRKDEGTRADHERMYAFARTFSFEQIVEEYRDYDWAGLDDPAILMGYCFALVETGSELPETLQLPAAPLHVHESALAFFHLYGGRLRDAYRHLMGIPRDEPRLLWRHTALMEYAFDTEQISYLGVLLANLEKLGQTSTLAAEVSSYYGAWYHFYSGEFHEVEKILAGPPGYWLAEDERLYLHGSMLIRENRFQEALDAIEKAPPEIRESQDVIILQGDIVALTEGFDRWLSFMRERHEQHPQMPWVEYWYAKGLVDAGEKERGIPKLKSVTERRPFDYWMQLETAQVFLHEALAEEQEFVLGVLKNPQYMESFSYKIFMAETYDLLGKKENSLRLIRDARINFPASTELLWYQHDRAFKDADYSGAEKAVRKILDMYPNDVDALLSLMFAMDAQEQWDVVLELEERVLGSKRFLSEAAKDNARFYSALALAEQGRIAHARKKAAAIVDEEFGAEAEGLIDEIEKRQEGGVDL
jgi:tetratricopeptide (TPR) repeat protein